MQGFGEIPPVVLSRDAITVKIKVGSGIFVNRPEPHLGRHNNITGEQLRQ